MTTQTKLRMTGVQNARLLQHLFPGDGREAVAVALCGKRAGENRHCLTVRQVELVPLDICTRAVDHITWPTEWLLPHLEEAAKRDLAVVKLHSHPGGFSQFSTQDDRSDRSLSRFVREWIGGDVPFGSVVFLPSGEMFGRTADGDGVFSPLSSIAVVGDDLKYWAGRAHTVQDEFCLRHRQLFGAGTTGKLQNLAIAVVGCSGTGSIVIQQLAHLGIGRLVLIDHDRVEEKNLNRIVGATMEDVRQRRFKVDVMRRYVEALELGTAVETFACDLATPAAVKAVAECDVVFGCMDGVEGRHLLNRLSVFYVLPYFDLGVRLDADGRGGVREVCGTVHYIQPGGSSLYSRGVYTLEEVRSAGLKRTDPAAYADELRSKYIVGVQEDRPAVISVNMQVASLAVNEFLARLHPYREDPNADYAAYRVSLRHGTLINEPDGAPCNLFARHTGRGDVVPLLDRPDLSDC